jgi:pimeloyl-ACP methyl ester carboxylesterase
MAMIDCDGVRLALLDALKVERAVLVGCSMGGAYAVEAALAAPERVALYRAKAAPVDPADAGAMAEAQVLWQVAGPDRVREDLAPKVWEAAVEMCQGAFTRLWSGPPAAERHLDPPAKGRLAEVEAPTLVVNGLADVPGIQEVSGLLAGGIPGASRLDLPDTGHLPPLERPHEVTAALHGFLAALH